MSTATQVRDYLGHPCCLTELHERVAEEVAQARRSYPANADQRNIPRAIGRSLLRLMDRLARASEALEAIARDLPEDADAACALLDMAGEYSMRTERRFQELAAIVLVALERGDGYPDHLKPDMEGGEA